MHNKRGFSTVGDYSFYQSLFVFWKKKIFYIICNNSSYLNRYILLGIHLKKRIHSDLYFVLNDYPATRPFIIIIHYCDINTVLREQNHGYINQLKIWYHFWFGSRRHSAAAPSLYYNNIHDNIIFINRPLV